MPVARGESHESDGVDSVSEVELSLTGDNYAALKGLMDWSESQPGPTTIRLPAGVWKISQSLEIVSDTDLEGAAADLTSIAPLDPISFAGPVMVAGASAYALGTRPRADDFCIRDLTIEQTAATSAGSHCFFMDMGDDCRFERVRFYGSKHEGMVSGNFSLRLQLNNCLAEDCGAGSVHRPLSGAGFNCNGLYHTLTDCMALRCGQGYEHAGTGTTFIRCHALDSIPAAGPSNGFSIGNGSAGVHGTRLLDCEAEGHVVSLVINNGIGRLGGVMVDGFKCNGLVSFGGGKDTNPVPHPDEGPAHAPSMLRNVEITVGELTANNPFVRTTYETEQGKSPLTVDNMRIIYAFEMANNDWPTPIAVTGNVVAETLFIKPEVRGWLQAPFKGDFFVDAMFTPLPPHTANVKVIGGKAFKADGVERYFQEVRREPL